MAFNTLTAKMTPLELEPGDVVQVEAIDIATGAAATGVKVRAITITTYDLSAVAGGTVADTGAGDPLLAFLPGLTG